MAKQILVYGKTLEELKQMDINELARLFPSRRRRSLRRGMTEGQKKLLERIRKGDTNIRTHEREMVILPEMVGMTIHVYTGKAWKPVQIQEEMIGLVLGEFALTRNNVKHSAPGIGATRSSAALSVR